MNAELERIRREYRRRDENEALSSHYAASAPGTRFLAERRERAILDALRAALQTPASTIRLLDLGCGVGADLVRFEALGIRPSALVGFDLLRERLVRARSRSPQSVLAQGNAGELPFPDETFDVVFQSMVFTSILDRDLRRRTASEMLRVLRPEGLILWYDFRWNPTNRATRGIGISELRRLFPRCAIVARRVTLAPPLAHIAAPIAPLGARALEAIGLFRSHYLAVIRVGPAKAGHSVRWRYEKSASLNDREC